MVLATQVVPSSDGLLSRLAKCPYDIRYRRRDRSLLPLYARRDSVVWKGSTVLIASLSCASVFRRK